MEVLLSAMFLKDWKYVDTLNISSDVTVINQGDEEKVEDVLDENRRIKYISTKERGLSRSRNMAIRNARHDICILCDNDVEYVEHYEAIIENAYKRHPDADVIVFYIKRDEKSKPYTTHECKLNFKLALNVFSPEISFKRSSLKEKNIIFNELFGAGSIYMMGEESIFLFEALKKGLKVYYCPDKIADLRYEESTWKTAGRKEKFFRDKGACYYVMTGALSALMNAQFVVRKRKLYDMSPLQAFRYMQQGKKEYKTRLGGDKYGRKAKNIT